MSAPQSPKEPVKKNAPDRKDQVDPLFTIFEQHLYNFQDSEIDRKTFVNNVVHEYLNYLRKLGISVPRPLEHAIVEELAIQVKGMLVKKIYGCLSITDYQKKQPVKSRRKVKSRYSKLQKAPARAVKPLTK
jgi:hypothetical protein